VEACSRNSKLPVSVKTRLGWSDAGQLPDFIKALANAGAAMVSIHGRTYQQKYRGQADWEPMYQLKKAVAIPVVGNGDLNGKDHALQMVKNLDGYMIGRASVGDPWVFWPDEKRTTLRLKDKIEIMIQHLQLLLEYKKEQRALVEFRKHISGYISGFTGAKSCRITLMKSQNEKEFIRQALAIT
jgi:tRNA-dihydrouridine synthase